MEEVSKILSPKLDVVFKELFSKKGNEDLLEDFLSSILDKKVKCKEVVKEARIGQSMSDEKYGTIDLKVSLEEGEEVDIEMQLSNKHDTINRSIKYSSDLTSSGLKIGHPYSEMTQKIVIFILDFELFKDYPQCIHESYLCLKEHKEKELSNLQKYYYIELPKIKEVTAESLRRLKYWMAFLNQEKELIEMDNNDEIIMKAQRELEYLSGDEELRRLAELRQRAIRDEIAIKRIAAEEGLKEGLEKGMEKGIKKGMKKGIYSVAKKMLSEKVDIDTIIKFTGLSKEEIKSIK